MGPEDSGLGGSTECSFLCGKACPWTLVGLSDVKLWSQPL